MSLSPEAQSEFDAARSSYDDLVARAESTENPAEKVNIMNLAKQAQDKAIKIQQTGRTFSGADALRFGAQGATLGGADEIEAGLRTGFGLAGDYGQVRDDIRADLAATREAYPTESYGFEIGGGFAIPGGALKNVPLLGKIPSIAKSVDEASTLPMAIRNLAVTGGGIGAGAGAGYSESNPIESPVPFAFDVGKGLGLGAIATPVIGAGAPLALSVGSRVLNKLSQPANIRADQLLGQVMRKTGWDEKTAMNRIGELGEDATLADLDDALLGWASVASEKSDEAAAGVEHYVNRNLEAKGRLVGAAEDAVEGRLGDFQKSQAGLESSRKAINNKQYGLIDEELVPFAAVEDIISTPHGRKAYQKSVENWQTRNRTDAVPEEMIPLAILDDTKQVLDKGASRVRSGQKGGTEQIYTDLASDLRTTVDDIVPPYRTARETNAAYKGVLEAGDEGRKVKASTTGEKLDEVEELLPGLSTREKRQFGLGWLEQFAEDVAKGGGSKGTGYAGSRFGTPEVRGRRFDLVEPPYRSGVLEDRFQAEDIFHDTASFLSPKVNSKTSAKEAARSRADMTAGIGGVLSEVIPDDVSAVANIIRNSAGVSEEVAAELGKRLMSPNISAAEVRRMIDAGDAPSNLLSILKERGIFLPFMGSAESSATGALSRP